MRLQLKKTWELDSRREESKNQGRKKEIKRERGKGGKYGKGEKEGEGEREERKGEKKGRKIGGGREAEAEEEFTKKTSRSR